MVKPRVAFVVMGVPENKKPVGAADGFRVPWHGIPVLKANLALAAFVMRPQAEYQIGAETTLAG